MAQRAQKYLKDMRTPTGFRASDQLNAAFSQARRDAQGKSGGTRDIAVRLSDHPEAMRRFVTELLERLDNGGEPDHAARIDGW